MVKLAGMEHEGDYQPLSKQPVRRPTVPASSTQGAVEDDLISRDQLPTALTNTLDHIVGQLSLIGRTMGILEQRLTLTENRISGLLSNARGISVLQPDLRPQDEEEEAADGGWLHHESGDSVAEEYNNDGIEEEEEEDDEEDSLEGGN